MHQLHLGTLDLLLVQDDVESHLEASEHRQPDRK